MSDNYDIGISLVVHIHYIVTIMKEIILQYTK